MQHQGLGLYKVCSTDDPGLTYFIAGSALLPNAFICSFIETNKMKVGAYRFLSECMNIHIYEYQRSMLLFGLCPRSLKIILSSICCQAAGHIIAKFHVEPYDRDTNCSNDVSHMTKMVASKEFLLWNQKAKMVTLGWLSVFKFACRKKD